MMTYSDECETKALELEARKHFEQKKRAAAFIKGFASRAKNPKIGELSDGEVRDLVSGRYS